MRYDVSQAEDKNEKLKQKREEMKTQFDKMLKNTLHQMDRKIKLANEKFENDFKNDIE